ncbi:MAG TPA: divalent-cation tolerance protein CutA [bacterium]|nr:divalent-cation tolerance protein CutA [bacterium]
MAKTCVVFVTVDKKNRAKQITSHVLKKKLAACVNTIGRIDSSYWWKGKIEKSGELLLIMKTKKSLFKKLEAEIKKIHPYSVPEIISLDITAGNPGYLSWILAETK